MISFWLSVAALLLLASLFLFWPLLRYGVSKSSGSSVNDFESSARTNENVRLYREHLAELENNLASQSIDAEQFAQLKLELERNLLNDEASFLPANNRSSGLGGKTLLFFSILILLSSVFIYQKFGSVRDVALHKLQQEKTQLDYQDMMQNRDPDIERAKALVVEYKARVKDKPDNVKYWFLLARTQMEVGDFASAAQAYQQILERDAQSPMIMAELAQAMFLRDGNKMSPPALDLAKGALALDPKNTMALGLVGIYAYNNKEYREAIQYWQKTISLLGAQSSGAQSLAAGIERAKQEFVAAGGKLEDLTTKSAYSLSLVVSLGAKVKASPDQIVFVYARAWQGAPMPLAIARIKVSELPKLVILDETMAMSPMASLANTTDVEVVARISTDGTAQAKVGDWQVKQGPISMKAIPEKLLLTIEEQISEESKKP